MFRRSRLSIRPNVGTTGRAASTPQEAPPSNQESAEPPKDNSESNIATAGTDNKSAVVQSEQTPPARDSNDQNVESTTSSAALQRRKRFSIKPKVVPGRPATLPRTLKSPIKPVLQSHIEVPNSDLDKPTSSQVSTTAPPTVLLSPRHRRASEESRQAKTHPKPTLPSSGSSETLSVPPAEDSVEQIHLRPDGGKKESSSAGQVKEVSLRQPDKVPPSLPDKEAIEMSEKAKTLVSSKSVISTSSSKFSLSRLLNDPSDLQRLEKAQKLRELLREEINKEKKLKKAKARVKEYNLDPAKMTMRDLIHYLPLSNPMTSSLQESAQEKETVVPQSPIREKSPERAQEPQAQLKMMSPRQQRAEEEEEEEEEAAADDEQDEALMVPQVKVAEDGSLIIDEESLTVEVQRTKGPNTVQDRDPIFERGSTTTYASFRKGNYSKPWSSEETDMFFLAISMVGTDFTMICQLFPHRGRSEIKNKFKKEERGNAWRIDKAFREKRRLDIEYFSKLLEKILEVQKNKKKLKSLSVKNKTPKKCIRKPKGKKAARKLSDVEEENEVDEEEEGEKENEELCNEGGSPVSKPTRKRKRKNYKGDASPEQPDSKINKRGEKKKKQDEASVPTDTEAALPEDHTTSTTSDQCDAPKDIAEIKPAKLSRGRAPKLPLPVGLKRNKKPAPSSTKSKENTSDKEGENMSEEASTEQVSKDASPSRQTSERESADENVESDEECSVKPPRPTRYGRVPKLTRHLNYPAKKETHSPASETTPASPAGHAASAAKAKPKGTAKRGRSARQQPAKESKKPKLITLRASQSEDSDDEDDEPSAAEAIMGCAVSCSGIDGGAAVFVPASLCSPHPLVTEVEETMEELDILANMPDVLGISQDALCPEASCEQAQNEAGTAEPCEHQLDLLVDVIDFLSSEHTEVSEDESYNEAAQTLLTIGNVAHLSHPSQNQASMEDLPSISVIANESSHQEESQSVPDLQQEISTCPISVVSAHEITEASETVGTMEPESNTTEERPPSQIAGTSVMNRSEEMYCEQKTNAVSDPQLQSNPESSKKTSVQTKKGRFSKIKPKPNIARASRTTQSNSQTNNNKLSLKTAEDGHSSASDIFQVSHSQQVPENISELQNSGPTVTGEISCSDVRLTEEPSGRQEAGRSVIADQSTSENQNSCIPETQLESSRENQLTTGPADDRTGDISYSNSLTSITVTGSASVYEGTDLVCVSLINQKEETEVTNTLETRRGRLHEVKSTDSQLQASETEQPETQTTQDPVTHLELVDKPSIQTANLQPTEKPAKKMETEPTGNATLLKLQVKALDPIRFLYHR
ncbi:transcription factor TFIIIB component B'' homolog isoform X2 [Sphaeramia orbicularis]|uniref:transcription factor TFIIIB component B'' homolog isoform X2 n=1 Tax=Sphaeramia orbicularis TaxID=375764 RepID=UPI001180B983|nr:transcription factor TFIIIB component B'' homolog isoform X2 [Sphaeramia orbicularis]